MSSPIPSLFLYDHPASSYAQKVRMALRLKNLPFTKETPQNLGLGEPNASFESANLRMEVPALIIDSDFKIFDSSVIVQYLEDAFPDAPSLLPKDPRERAVARMIEEMCDTAYEAINWALGEVFWFGRAEGKEAERINAAAADQTKQIHEWLTPHLGSKDFFNGDAPGLADICVAPVFHRSVLRGLGPAKDSALDRWHTRMGEVPAIAETWREMEGGVQGMSNAGPGFWAPHSGRRREYRDHRLEFLMKNGAGWIVNKGLEDDNVRFGRFPRVN
ncbi:hypothetical protein M409DRAFT_21099 [Zasmidium cellare ATCC 36951]|uniref:GST N-terminal domain-containing protein n=1 Tax=Zasmidium cellare ATCC 36951 TaxID=1080233 RepID=A0A6A6CSC8_ZASCE|nr:uncharacterized protein M409DRAFT_21099 [Zasmidium cellare ATCC 36951]KAF2169088.1 hypothetical protein M409DRAFT_21099 [Zasmidium cellare ATCC 36951]